MFKTLRMLKRFLEREEAKEKARAQYLAQVVASAGPHLQGQELSDALANFGQKSGIDVGHERERGIPALQG